MPQTNQAERQRQLRAHYRQFLQTRDGRPYNPVLDDPNDERNPRHWTHGIVDGGTQAGCGCEPCRAAVKERNEAQKKDRLENRHATQKAIITGILTEYLPELQGAETDQPTANALAAAVERVHSVHRVVNRFRALIAYDRPALASAVRTFPQGAAASDERRDQLVDALHAALNQSRTPKPCA